MKKILAVALVLCLVLALAPMAFADNPVVKIGVFEPQSGDNGCLINFDISPKTAITNRCMPTC